MEENKNTQIDSFLKNHLQEIPLDRPSKDFTANIMASIAKEKSISIAYTPLISKKVWILIAACIVAVFFIPFQKEGSSILEKIPLDFSFIEKIPQFNISGLFDGLTMSSSTFYGLLLFSVMVIAQVFYLKGYFQRRFTGIL